MEKYRGIKLFVESKLIFQDSASFEANKRLCGTNMIEGLVTKIIRNHCKKIWMVVKGLDKCSGIKRYESKQATIQDFSFAKGTYICCFSAVY
jgi:hypothetical protein